MIFRCETFRNDKGIAVLQTVKVSHLSIIPNRFYESPKLKNWMCELCTFSQIRSHIMTAKHCSSKQFKSCKAIQQQPLYVCLSNANIMTATHCSSKQFKSCKALQQQPLHVCLSNANIMTAKHCSSKQFKSCKALQQQPLYVCLSNANIMTAKRCSSKQFKKLLSITAAATVCMFIKCKYYDHKTL